MWTVVSQEQAGQLAHQPAIVSVLLAQRMNADLLRWVYDAWSELDGIAGPRWHVVVPSYSSSWLNSRPSVSDYNHELARDYANSLGIQPNELPCLVIEDFCEDAPQLRISLNIPEPDRSRLINDFAAAVKGLPSDDVSWDLSKRRNANLNIYLSVRGKSWARSLLRVLPKAAPSLLKVLIKH